MKKEVSRASSLTLLSLLLLMLLIAAVEFNSSDASGLSFMRTWGSKLNEGAASVVIDSSGNLYIVGTTDDFGAGFAKAFVLKYSSSGSILWQKVWNGSIGEGAEGVVLDSSNNVYVTGTTSSFNSIPPGQAFLLKVDSSGALLWQKAWGNYTHGKSVAATSEGSIYLTGSLLSTNGTQYTTILRLDPDGRLMWQKVWTGSNNTLGGLGMTVDAAGSLYLVSSKGGDSLLVKFNSTGSIQWQRAWHLNGTNKDVANSVAIDSKGNIIVGGWTCGCSNTYLPNRYNATVSKFDVNGTFLWETSWQDTTQGAFSAASVDGVVTDSSENIYATGGAAGVFLLELNSSGGLLPASSIVRGSLSGDAVILDSLHTPIVVGAIDGPPASFHAITLRPTLDAPLPTLTSPAGVLQDLHYDLVNITGTLRDVQGSTAYAGGYDVFLNYGYTFAIPIVSPMQIIFLACTIGLLVRRALSKGKARVDSRVLASSS